MEEPTFSERDAHIQTRGCRLGIGTSSRSQTMEPFGCADRFPQPYNYVTEGLHRQHSASNLQNPNTQAGGKYRRDGKSQDQGDLTTFSWLISGSKIIAMTLFVYEDLEIRAIWFLNIGLYFVQMTIIMEEINRVNEENRKLKSTLKSVSSKYKYLQEHIRSLMQQLKCVDGSQV
jgi:hypothetical protein